MFVAEGVHVLYQQSQVYQDLLAGTKLARAQTRTMANHASTFRKLAK